VDEAQSQADRTNELTDRVDIRGRGFSRDARGTIWDVAR